MNIIKIPKKKRGEFRTICAPSLEEKINISKHLPILNKKVVNNCDSKIVHGFVVGKSPITNAMVHRGFRFSLCFDLADFFNSITENHLKGRLTKEEGATCLFNGSPMQGLPSSPAIANLAAIPMDKAIKKFISKIDNDEAVYTRYADDLTISFNFHWSYSKIKEEISNIVSRCGFKLNESKTRLQDSLYGRRVITGVSVGYFNVKAPRSIKRRIRAAKHQGEESQLAGLTEWSKMKLPKDKSLKIAENKIIYKQSEIDSLCKGWRLGKIKAGDIPMKKEEFLEDNLLITGDPAYMLGMSTFTNGWVSCMKFGGSYFFGVKFWLYLKGARVVTLLSEKELIISGVTRKTMKARALLFNFRDGSVGHGRIYGDSQETRDHFSRLMSKHGIPSVEKKGVKVNGNVRLSLFKKKPYFDIGNATKGRLKGESVITYSI